MAKLSVVLAARNEEENIGDCLESIKDIADEIVVVDEYSTDKTVEIAKKYGAKVYEEPHHEIFHITKQKALNKATYEWVLQLDADEVVTAELAKEIKEVINLSNEELKRLRTKALKNKLFLRHERVVEERDGKIGKDTGKIVAFFIPRRNLFLGKPLIHAGVYPDPSIRLVKNGKAHFTGKSVHDIMQVDGEVSWLTHDMLHNDSPTFSKYLARMNRYTDLKANEFREAKIAKNVPVLFYYSFVKPLAVFLTLYLRHKGLLDGMRGFIWSFFSALHYPIAYFKYFNREPK